MGITVWVFTLSFLSSNIFLPASGSEDVELKDPRLLEVTTFAATTLLKDSSLELENFTLQRILDSQVFPQPEPLPTYYLLTLEMGQECADGDDNCDQDEKKICEAAVLDTPWDKKQTIIEEKSSCRTRETEDGITFSEIYSSVASSIPFDDPETKALVDNAITQMAANREGKHLLKQIGQARKVMMQETNSKLYYLSLYISTGSDDLISEVCEVTMEENLSSQEQTLQSMRCFATGDGEGVARLGIVPIPVDELNSGLVRSAIMASLAVIDAESQSQFQLKVVGYSVPATRSSVDSGTRDLELRLGLVPTLCIKHPAPEEEETQIRSCPVDTEREPSICSITLTQWPWVADGYLFSDLDCSPTNFTVISEELETFSDDDDDDAQAESDLEVEEISSNAVQASNREDDEDEDEEEAEADSDSDLDAESDSDSESDEEVEEEVAVAEVAPCTGCPVELDPEDDAVIELASLGLTAFEESASSDRMQRVERVVQATRQVVNGIKYELTVETVETSCPRGANADRSECEVEADADRRTCTVTILDQSWLGPKKVQEASCVDAEDDESSPSRSLDTNQVADSVTVPNDAVEVLSAAAFALDSLDSFDEDEQKRVLVRVLSASYTPSVGKVYNLKIEQAMADCSESSEVDDSDCKINDESARFICDVEVLAQSLTDVPKRLVDSKCVPAVSADDNGDNDGDDDDDDDDNGDESEVPVVKKSQSLATAKELNLDDLGSPQVQEVARFAATTIGEKSNDENSVKLLKVVRATRHTDSGDVSLDVEVGFTTCAKEGAAADCPLDQSRSTMMCRVAVSHAAALDLREVMAIECNDMHDTSTSEAIDSTDSTDTSDAVKSTDSMVDLDADVTTETAPTDAAEPVEDTVARVTSQRPQVQDAPVTPEPQLNPEAVDPMAQEIQRYVDFALTAVEQRQSGANQQKLEVVSILASSIQGDPDSDHGKHVLLALEVAPTDCRQEEACAIGGVRICNVRLRAQHDEGQHQVLDLQCRPKPQKRLRLARPAARRQARSEDFDESPFVGPVPFQFRLGQSSIVLPRPSGGDRPSFPIAGGFHDVSNTDSDAVREIADFAVATISQSVNGGVLTLRKIVSIQKQVVAGLNYKMEVEVDGSNGVQTCHAVVFDQRWTSTRRLTSFRCTEPKSGAEAVDQTLDVRRRKRSTPRMLGTSTAMDLDDPKIKSLSDRALTAISQRSNDLEPLGLLRVIRASKQVVSGMLYTLVLSVGTADGSSRQRCNVTIWEQPWLDKSDVTQVACNDKGKERHGRSGAVSPADAQSDEIQSAAAFALPAIQAQSNAANRLSVVAIKKAATQVVAGRNIFLTLEVAETRCAVASQTQAGDCTVDEAAPRQICKVKIWSRPWLNERRVLKTKCRPSSVSVGEQLQRLKRDQSKTDAKSHSRSSSKSNTKSKSKSKSNKRKELRRLKHMAAFRSFITNFGRIYKTWAEFDRRYKIYRANQKRVELLNLNEMGTAEYGDTEFSDLTEEEFKERRTGLKPLMRHGASNLRQAEIPDVELPEEYDWRNYNAVTPVKDQGSCGSCWAFSVTGNIEGMYGVQHGELVSLSEQELVDCDVLDSGCNGGLPENAYKAIQDLGGLELETDYPYNAHENKCHFDKNITRVQVTGAIEISKNETKMAQWILKHGPVSIGINANAMQFYRGGVSHPWKVLCRPGSLDHGVLIVGFGVAKYPKFNKTMPYWIVKNSWGPRWGEQGYYRVYRGDGTCGVNQMVTSAVVA